MQTDKSRAVAHYEALAAQAQHIKAAESTSLAAMAGRNEMLACIKTGVDAPFPLIVGGRTYKVSSFLGECDRHAQVMLFSACHAAMSGKPAEEVKAKLAQFVDAVCREYGEDSADVWGDDE